MLKIKNLVVYDFDDTLFFSPKPDLDENGELVKPLKSDEYENKTGRVWEFIGWWGRPESLDMNIFKIERNSYIFDKYTKDVEAGKTVIMMTGRLKKLSTQVKSILDSYNMDFDGYYYNPGGMNTLNYKLKVLDEYVANNPDMESITLYDDRDSHIPTFLSWGKKVEELTDIKVEVVHVRGEGRVN